MICFPNKRKIRIRARLLFRRPRKRTKPSYNRLAAQKSSIASEHFDENKWLGAQISELMDLKTKTVLLEQEVEDLRNTQEYTQEELSSSDSEIQKLKSELNSKVAEEKRFGPNIPASVVSSPRQNWIHGVVHHSELWRVHSSSKFRRISMHSKIS